MCYVYFNTIEIHFVIVSNVLKNECILVTNKCCIMEFDQLNVSSRLFSQKLIVSRLAKKRSAFILQKKNSWLCSRQLDSEFCPDW
jgi:hypothetical protein